MSSLSYRKNERLQHLLGDQISNYRLEDGELSRRLDALREMTSVLSSLEELTKNASSVKVADYKLSVDGLKWKLCPRTESDFSLLRAVNADWADKDSSLNDHLLNIMTGVQSLEDIALNVRVKNEEMSRLIASHQSGMDHAIVEISQLQTRIKWISKLMAGSRFWCYLWLMIVIVMLSMSFGFLVKKRINEGGFEELNHTSG
eukprot:GHVH01002157.1.p2 GENE.GHVH01002157.1~~GHVH01002157.1.p2  ORF type:complete len:202 (-),score=35.94 GHVH01002157.1:154-759(-)